MKGKTNNPDGRPKGTPNKITTELRARISDFLEGQWPQVEQAFETLESKEKILLFEKLLQYVLSRLQTTELRTPDLLPDSELARKARERMAKLAAEGAED